MTAAAFGELALPTHGRHLPIQFSRHKAVGQRLIIAGAVCGLPAEIVATISSSSQQQSTLLCMSMLTRDRVLEVLENRNTVQSIHYRYDAETALSRQNPMRPCEIRLRNAIL